MLVRKTQISKLLKKEKQKERKVCQKESELRIMTIKKQMADEFSKEIRSLKRKFGMQVKSLEKENDKLKKEMLSNYALYQTIRRREEALEQLSSEIEEVMNTMTVKIQESLQPFYRTRAKIESTKRKSDRKHEKTENILRAVK